MARKSIPPSKQKPTNNPAHLGVKRNKRIGKRTYFVAKNGDMASLPEYIPGTLYRTRPLIFATPQELMDTALNYIAKAIENEKPITFSGFLAFSGTFREALFQNYNTPDFLNTINQVKAMIESFLVDKSLTGVYQHQIAQLILKNFHGFKDKVEIESANINLNASSREDIIKAVEEARKDKNNNSQVKSCNVVVDDTSSSGTINQDYPIMVESTEGCIPLENTNQYNDLQANNQVNSILDEPDILDNNLDTTQAPAVSDSDNGEKGS